MAERLPPTVFGPPKTGVETLTVTGGPELPDGPGLVVPAMQAPSGAPMPLVLALQDCDPS